MALGIQKGRRMEPGGQMGHRLELGVQNVVPGDKGKQGRYLV